MEKTRVVLLLCFIVIIMVMPMAQGVELGPKAVEKWFKKLPHAKQKVTKLHFYFHDIVSGKNPTAVQIAQSNMTAKSPTSFGFVAMMDDPLTVGPETNSRIVGRAQGIYGSADQNEGALLMTLNFVFTTGKYNGSTLSVLGRNPVFHQYREMPIVGGSGVFRLAQGIATAKTYWFNLTSGDAVVEYNVMVLHYSH
ncbi:dirigent protein 21-like [Solanum stenotomum]|uniref:dirigent protein 21-like n=1 Tax=Solanum stenotomum TaxID=172797 RepID=UPI0020D1B7CF|nr:dirigent protein 21-like [Solanum stenotomum]